MHGISFQNSGIGANDFFLALKAFYVGQSYPIYIRKKLHEKKILMNNYFPHYVSFQKSIIFSIM